MNKRYVLAFLFVSVLFLTLFLRKTNKSNPALNTNKQVKVKTKSKSKYLNNRLATQEGQHSLAIQKEIKTTEKDYLDKQLDKDEKEFHRIDLLWSKLMQKKFEQMGLSRQKYDKYQSMREDFEQEAIREFDHFHQALQEIKGKNYKYRLTEFDDKVMNRLRKEYNEKLAQVVGEKATREIVKTRDEFNEKLKLGTNKTLDDFIIDF